MIDDAKNRDEFYVGYLKKAPEGIASRIRAAMIFILLIAALAAAVVATTQDPFGSGSFEFDLTEFKGVITEGPHPVLLVARPGSSDEWSTYFLTVFGKRGAHDVVQQHQGRAVKLRGNLIYRDGRTMVQIEDGSITSLGGIEASALLERPRPRSTSLGSRTLVGEIVDSKCFLGVMKPGNLKPHRSCAARCISGGVPPVLLVRDENGYATYYVLTGSDGSAINQDVLPYIAEPVTITGEVEQQSDLLVLRADPSAIQRLP